MTSVFTQSIVIFIVFVILHMILMVVNEGFAMSHPGIFGSAFAAAFIGLKVTTQS